jgi:hypothetical protein
VFLRQPLVVETLHEGAGALFANHQFQQWAARK